MSQLIYAFSAVVIAALLSFQFFVGSRTTQLQVHRNEVLSQVGGLAAEIIEEIGRRAFDHRTRDDLFESPPASPAELTPRPHFGGIALEDCDSLCLDMDDFHGLELDRKFGGFDFDVSIAVRYVDPDRPHRVSRLNTYAKEVILTITNPNIHYANRPDSLHSIKIGRVFTYQQTN